MDPDSTSPRRLPYVLTSLLVILILLAGIIFWFRAPLGTAWTAFMVPSELRSVTFFGTSPVGGSLFRIGEFGFSPVTSAANVTEYAQSGSTEVGLVKGKIGMDVMTLGAPSQVVSPNGVFKSFLSLSNDGTKALYAESHGESIATFLDASLSQVTLLDLGTKSETLIGVGTDPFFLSPDGTVIGFLTPQGFFIKKVGSQIQTVTISKDFTTTGVRPISVSSDGKFLVAYDTGNSSYVVYSITLTSSSFTTQSLGTLQYPFTSIAFSGDTLYGLLTTEGKSVVYKYPLSSGSLGSGSLLYTFPSSIKINKINE